MATGKDVRFGDDARKLMLRGVEETSRAVASTLGPKGRNVVIDQSYGAPKITKDGVTVAKSIDFSDRYKNLGAQLVKQVASKTNDIAGDGTTTATILTHSIFAEGCKAVAANMNPMDLRRGIQAAVTRVLDNLKEHTKHISSKEEIQQVATISANGDTHIGNLIATAMERVGKEGVITVQDGKTLQDELDVVEGMRFDRGYISPYFVTDPKSQKCEFENPYILITDKKLSTLMPILPLLEGCLKSNKPLVIIAEDVEGEVLATLIVNKLRGGVRVCAVKAPGFGDNRKAMLQDIAVVTGGQLISEDVGLTLEKATLEMLGSAAKVSISKDDTVLLDGSGSKAAIEERCNLLRDSIKQSTSEYEKEKMQERLAKLVGGVAVIKVGGASEVEVNEKKDRITDALNATRCAVDQGIVPGGGVALLYASLTLDDLATKTQNHDQKFGIQIVKKAIQEPAKIIINNAGMEGSLVVGKLVTDAGNNSKSTRGMNSATGEYCDMIQSGIIDPTLVVKTALVDAASVASLMITAEVAVVDLPEKAAPAGQGTPSGMNPMDYM